MAEFWQKMHARVVISGRARYKDWMDKFFSYIPRMVIWIGNHEDLPNYTSNELVKNVRS